MNRYLTELRPAPPLTLGAALLLWGWQTGFMIFALPMAMLFELSHRVSWRWPISNREFNHVSDISGVAFFITVVYIFTQVGTQGIFVILSVMPFVLFVLVLLQLYSEKGRVPLSALFVSLRRLDPRTSARAAQHVDVTLPYILLCIISASTGNQRTPWFFFLSFVLIAAILRAYRPRSFRAPVWSGMLAIALVTSYAGQEGLKDLQRYIETSIIGMFDQFMWRYRDPDKATTAIGTLGRLKLSERIVLRLKPDTGRLSEPLLLREASYHKYSYGVWSNMDAVYTLVDPGLDGNWPLGKGSAGNSAVISTHMQDEIGVIPLPHGTTDIRDVAATAINLNQYGAVQMEIREGWIEYRADYAGAAAGDSPPRPGDLEVPHHYQQDFARLAAELDLYGKPPPEVIAIIEGFFRDNFRYSLTQRNRYPRGKYLSGFLFESREGHCEYFATSTVMLLREAGIPSRYAVGYAVNEYSPLEGRYIARSSDAHSWAQAWTGGSWRVVDTTPPVWVAFDNGTGSMAAPFMDLFSWISYQYSRFQNRNELEEEQTNYDLLYLLIPLILILAWRLYFRKRITRERVRQIKERFREYQGMDSELYRLSRELQKAGYARRQGETLARWLRRVDESAALSGLDRLAALHYRYRFDPQGGTEDVREEIAEISGAMLDELRELRQGNRELLKEA